MTNSRFIARGQTFAMSGVTSVKSLQQNPSRKGPFITIIIGIISLMAGGDASIMGFILIAAGVGWWIAVKPTITVI